MTSPTETPETQPGAWILFRIWVGIGLQSFGGGAATTFLIQRVFIQQRRWLTIEEFTRLYNLCLLTPGITLVALTTLIGKKLGGTRGIVASLAGLLAPSATITCLLAALFTHLEQSSATKAVLRGVIPATAGVMALVLLNFARPLVRGGRNAGPGLPRLLAKGAIVLAIALAVILANLSAIVVVIAAALVGVFFFKSDPRPPLSDVGDAKP